MEGWRDNLDSAVAPTLIIRQGFKTPGSQLKSSQNDSIQASVHLSGLNLLAWSLNSRRMTKLIENGAKPNSEVNFSFTPLPKIYRVYTSLLYSCFRELTPSNCPLVKGRRRASYPQQPSSSRRDACTTHDKFTKMGYSLHGRLKRRQRLWHFIKTTIKRKGTPCSAH